MHKLTKKTKIRRGGGNMSLCLNVLSFAAVAASAMLPMAAQARSMLYYYDFDTIENGSLVYTNSTDHADINKGSGTAEFHKSTSSPEEIPYTTDGAFGSSGAFYANSKGTIWLGDGSTSLGCSTVQGFTLSFWLKSTSSHTEWRDFLGFTVGGVNYRLEYTTSSTSAFSVWRSTSSSDNECVSTNDMLSVRNITQATAGEWNHVAFVFAPGTNSLGQCAIYVGGEKVGSMKVVSAGSLSRVCVGPLVAAWNDGERNASNGGNDTKTGIDELAVFDYPATAEQVKWLAKYKPAQPANGPGREMPICWHLDESETGVGVLAVNSGTATNEAYKWDSSGIYANWKTDGGVLDSAKAFRFNNNATWRVDGDGSNGLGATIGSGFSISFWIQAPSSVTAWRDFMSFRLGDNYERLEWANASNPVQFGLYGTVNTSSIGDRPRVSLEGNAWQHVCMVWNSAASGMDLYLDGVKTSVTMSLSSPNGADALKSFTIGPRVFDENGGQRNQGTTDGYLDEIAIFNHAISMDSIAWLRTHIPMLPPLDATNIVRTVSADCSWAGGFASWGVKEWNGEAWADTTRTMIYPALEDTEVETAVAFASGATITNDTFVTPKRLSLSNASGGASVAPTLVCAEGSLFAPESMEIGDGVTLNVSAPFGDPVSAGTLTFGEGAKIVFDSEALLASDPDEKEWKTVMTFGSVVLPSGEANVLSHFGVSNGKYALKLSDDGKSVLAKRTRGFIIAVF